MIDLTCRRIQHLDERRDLIICGNEQQTIDYSVKHWVDCSKHSIKEKGTFQVALSGGSTPKKIFQTLCSSPIKETIQWDKVFLFWSDERSVDPNNENSNYYMAMQAGFTSVPIPSNQIFRMHAEQDIKSQAEEYEHILKKNLKDQKFDLVMLGMGDDGHTASLFPETKGLKEQEKLVVANYIPQKKSWRMTLTFKAINNSHCVSFYVLGSQKKKMLKNVLLPNLGSPTYPAQLVGTPVTKALWITDIHAAELLKS